MKIFIQILNQKGTGTDEAIANRNYLAGRMHDEISEVKTSKHHETGNISPVTPLFWEYLKTSEREQICVKVKTYFPEQRRSVWPLIPRADFKSHGLTLIGEEQHLPRAMTIDGFSRDVGSGNQRLQHMLVAILCDLIWMYWAGDGRPAINWNYVFFLDLTII